MQETQRQKPRIVIYGTGLFGTMAAQLVRAHGWPIVAAYNRAGDKVGKDLGVLAGQDPWGIVVEDSDLADFSKVEADVAIMATTDRLAQNMTGYERMIGAGFNVICHGSEAYFARGIDMALHDKVDALAKAHGVSFLGTGVWDYSRIWAGILVAGPCQSIERLFHKSITNIGESKYTDVVGIGFTRDKFEQTISKVPGPIGGIYKTIPQHVLYGLGYTIKDVSEKREPVLFDHPVWCPALEKNIEPGISAGTRIVVDVTTEQGVTAAAHIELRVFEPGEEDNMLWQVVGNPSSDIRTVRRDSGTASAACMVNRVRDIIAAPPGINLVCELGPIKSTALEPGL
ncbi:MAG: hypothetical protein AAF607_05315 [Pseudomonadota bacterium]